MSDDERDPRAPYRGPQRSAPHALSRLSGPVSLVDVAREIEQADAFLSSTTSAKLHVIADQMRALREAAQAVLEKAERDARLHRAEARFKRYPGRVYHLYQRVDDSLYWSLLSPAEWNGAPPHPFVASYRLEADQSFTELGSERGPAEQAELASWLKTRILPGSPRE